MIPGYPLCCLRCAWRLGQGSGVDVQSGGALQFLRSLREEIIPFVEANYRVTPADWGLAGNSYGGLFSLYALFHASQTFVRYFAGSPTMSDQLFQYEAEYAGARRPGGEALYHGRRA